MGIEIIAAWFFKDLRSRAYEVGLALIWKDLVASGTLTAASMPPCFPKMFFTTLRFGRVLFLVQLAYRCSSFFGENILRPTELIRRP
jgi:hypothetical protein